MTPSSTVEISLPHFGRPVFSWWGWSGLLHMGIIALFSVSQVSNTIEVTRPAITVSLIDTTTIGQPTISASEQKEPSTQIPSLLNARQPLVPLSQQTIPSPRPLTNDSLRIPVTHVRPPSQTQEKIQPIQRRILQDTRATNTLKLKHYLKIAQRQPAHRSTGQIHKQPVAFSGIPASVSPASLPTRGQIPLPSHKRKATVPSLSSQMLLAKPAGATGFFKAKVETAIHLNYPLIARREDWEGTVRIRVVVQSNGLPGMITIQKSSGYPVLDQAAVTAVEKMRFIPAKDGNIPVRGLVEIPIKFDLKQPL